jgi:H+/Cl- antiporter ClcA
LLWPGAPIAAFAVIGAAAVLATTQRAPLCAIVLVMEFTETGLDLLIPILIAVAGALLTARLLPATGGEHDPAPVAMA